MLGQSPEAVARSLQRTTKDNPRRRGSVKFRCHMCSLNNVAEVLCFDRFQCLCLFLSSLQRHGTDFKFFSGFSDCNVSELLIQSPVWTDEIIHRQREWIVDFITTQNHLTMLDLEATSLRISAITEIVQAVGLSLKRLRLYGFEDELYVDTFDWELRHRKKFRSLPAATIQIIRAYCPNLTKLSIDLTKLNIKTSSPALYELCLFKSLQHLEITTLLNTLAIDPYYRQMTTDRALNIARAAWSPTLQTLHLFAETMQGDEFHKGDTGSWFVTKCGVTGQLRIVDEVATREENRFKA